MPNSQHCSSFSSLAAGVVVIGGCAYSKATGRIVIAKAAFSKLKEPYEALLQAMVGWKAAKEQGMAEEAWHRLKAAKDTMIASCKATHVTLTPEEFALYYPLFACSETASKEDAVAEGRSLWELEDYGIVPQEEQVV
jgi:hypothetical protein